MQRITFEVTQQKGSRTLVLRGVWQPFGQQASVQRSLVRRLKVPEGITLDEAALWELASAIEGEVSGWQAKLPLDYS